MTVTNKTRKTILTSDLIIAKTFAAQNIGLLAYNKPVALLIPTRFGIHTFFMKYSIDVIVLDKNNTVVKLQENLKPNKIFIWDPSYPKILELPVGTIENSRTKFGDQLVIDEKKDVL